MNSIECGSRKGKIRHFIDTDKYDRVSKSKSLCGKAGKDLIRYNAVFFNYEVAFPNCCKKCSKIIQDMLKK